MSLKVKRQTMAIVMDIFRQKKDVAKIAFRPQKARFKKRGKTGTLLPRSTPEKEGVSSRYLLEFLQKAQEHPTLNPHTILVIRHGKVICDCSFAPYRSNIWHVTHSMCKSITALAIGMAVDSGKLSLDEKICDIFPGMANPLANPLAFRRMKSITVRHLLTMSSGVEFGEAGSVTSENWLKDYFSAGISFEPGSQFAYNSMNTYVLAEIVKAKTGKGLVDYLRPRLFIPLGIERVAWEKSPTGVEKGGWGLYLCPEDMGKIGLLMLQKGMWKNRRLISESFIREMTEKKVDTPASMGEQGYGYQVWMGKRPGSYVCNGILGQNIIVIPDLSMVVVTTGGNDCLFKTSDVISLVEEYFEKPDFQLPVSLPADRQGWEALKRFQASAVNREAVFPEEKRKGLFWKRDKLPLECGLLDGKKYTVIPGSARLLPLFTQMLQNNYSTRIDSLSFRIEEENFIMTVGEGKEKNDIILNFHGENQISSISTNRENYLVCANARFAKDEDGNTVLKVLLPFLENSNERKVKVFFYRDKSIALKLTETPSFESLLGDFGLLENKTAAALITRTVAKDDADVFAYTVQRATSPQVKGMLAEKGE